MTRRLAAAALAALLGLASLLGGAAPASAHTVEQAFLEEIGFDQRLGAEVPLDLPFRSSEGRPVTIGGLLGDKPAILVMLYYKCTMLCPLILESVVRALTPIGFDAGREFNLVVVSINPRETPSLAANRKALYVERYGRPGAADGFHFLTGEEPAIRALAAAVGLRYREEPKRKDEFSHAAGLVLLTPQGRVARYFYGLDYHSRDVRLGLIEAAGNTIGSRADQVLLFCMHYDPTTGRYGVAIMRLLQVAGFATVLCLGSFIAVMLRREHRAAAGAGKDG